MSLILYNFQELLIIFENFFVQTNFSSWEIAHKAPLNTVLACFNTIESIVLNTVWSGNAKIWHFVAKILIPR